MKIKVKYHSNIEKLKKIAVGEWIDLCAAETVELKSGEYRLISLGISVQLPEGCEANIVPRSSTYKNYGIIQANHFGVIDNSFNGDGDIWHFPAIAFIDTKINKGDRICQFRINKTMEKEFSSIEFEEVNNLGTVDRGGFGSTGKNKEDKSC